MRLDTALLIVALGMVVVIAAFAPAYALNFGANTYNEDNSADTQYITVGVDDTQYSSAITNTVEYRTEVVVDSGRTVTHIPDKTGTLIYESSPVDICELGVLDLTVSSSETLSSYVVQITPVGGTMSGTFYLRYWTDPAQNLNRETVTPTGVCAFNTSTGCSFNVSPAASEILVSLCLEAETVVSAQEPPPALSGVSFAISVVGTVSGGGS